jgi:peptidyl-prolyl cis-trans isomerase C
VLHFIVLGAAVFALHRAVAPPVPGKRIVLSESVIRGLRQDHLRRYGTLPTPVEEAALIQRFIDDEILYREALALGLDRGDIIVRRRLVQKMEFLTEDMEPIPEPRDAELQAYLDTHADRYAVADRVAMTHVFAANDGHPEDVSVRAARLHEQLAAGADPSRLGDPFLRGRDFPLHSERELAGIFGAAFAARVMSLPVGSWSEPIRSSYGLHLVRVTQRYAGHHPNLNDVRTAVRHDWQEERRAEANRDALARLRQRYEILIDSATLPSASSVAHAQSRTEG